MLFKISSKFSFSFPDRKLLSIQRLVFWASWLVQKEKTTCQNNRKAFFPRTVSMLWLTNGIEKDSSSTETFENHSSKAYKQAIAKSFVVREGCRRGLICFSSVRASCEIQFFCFSFEKLVHKTFFCVSNQHNMKSIPLIFKKSWTTFEISVRVPLGSGFENIKFLLRAYKMFPCHPNEIRRLGISFRACSIASPMV